MIGKNLCVQQQNLKSGYEPPHLSFLPQPCNDYTIQICLPVDICLLKLKLTMFVGTLFVLMQFPFSCLSKFYWFDFFKQSALRMTDDVSTRQRSSGNLASLPFYQRKFCQIYLLITSGGSKTFLYCQTVDFVGLLYTEPFQLYSTRWCEW